MKIKLVSERLSNGVLFLTFKIGKTEICYSSEWGVLELYKGDENLLENNRAVLYNNISEIKKKYESREINIQSGVISWNFPQEYLDIYIMSIN